MSVSEDDDLSQGTAELTREARKNLGHMSDAQHERGLQAVRGFPARRRSEHRRRWLAVGGATSAMAIAAFLLAPRVMQRMHAGPPPLALEVESGAIDPAGAIVARNDEPAALHFGDGTVIRLGTETRGRLAEVDGHGAHVAIDNGSAHVSVVHKPQARWLIDAGPYRITVHGTVFSASWDEVQQRLDVKMERGLVSVAGPVTNGPIAVRAGQALTVKLKRSQVLLRDLDRDEVVADVDADADTDADKTVAAPTEEQGSAPTVAVAQPSPTRARVAAKVARAQRGRSLDGRPLGRRLRHHPRRGRARHWTRARRRAAPTTWPRWPTPPATAVTTTSRAGRCSRSGAGSLARRAPRTPRSSSAVSTRTAAADTVRPWPGTNAISTRRRAARTWRKRWAAR